MAKANSRDKVRRSRVLGSLATRRLLALVAESGLTLWELRGRTGLSTSSLGRILRGEQVPSLIAAEAILAGFGQPWAVLDSDPPAADTEPSEPSPGALEAMHADLIRFWTQPESEQR